MANIHSLTENLDKANTEIVKGSNFGSIVDSVQTEYGKLNYKDTCYNFWNIFFIVSIVSFTAFVTFVIVRVGEYNRRYKTAQYVLNEAEQHIFLDRHMNIATYQMQMRKFFEERIR